MILLQLIINGIIAGAIYALMASSFSLIYNTIKFMDLSPGAIFVIGAFAMYTFHVTLGVNIVVAIILALTVAMIFGVLVNQFVYRPLRNQGASSFILLLASFGVFLFLTGAVLLVYGAESKSLSNATGGIDLGAFTITNVQIILITVSLILFGALSIFTTYTKMGKAMRALADDRDAAATVGISTEKIILITVLIASFLAGSAGILVAYEQNLEHSMGFNVILKGLTASIIGGAGNIPAALIGGFLIGILENLGIWILPSGYKDAIAFILLVIFLIVRPKGILGVKTREEGSG